MWGKGTESQSFQVKGATHTLIECSYRLPTLVILANAYGLVRMEIGTCLNYIFILKLVKLANTSDNISKKNLIFKGLSMFQQATLQKLAEIAC